MEWEPLEIYQWLAEEMIIEVRTSAFCRYYWCAEQARLMATFGLEAPHEGFMDEGRDVHERIAGARKPSLAEQEFLEKLAPFYVGGKISRTFRASEEVTLHLHTHGVDEWKVVPPNQVWIVEYKTKSSLDVTPVDLAPAIFQVKLYEWIHEPVLRQLGYKLMGGLIVFLRRRGIYPIGEVEVKIDYEDIEADMRHILHQFKHPEDLIPPKRWKCVKCPTVFKERCVFQK